MTRNAFQTYSHLSIIHSGTMDTHVDSNIYTKRLRVNLYVYHILFLLLRDILTKLEERSLAPSCSQAISYPHCSFVFIPRYVYRYPHDWITNFLAKREWVPLYRVGPESISLHREGENPILETSPLLDTLSNVPRTYFTNSHLRENSSKN